MNANSELTWKDINSPTMTPKEYMEKFRDKIAYNYESYEPKKKILKKIAQLLISNSEVLKILVLGAEWCPDCNKNVPRIIKIIKIIDKVNIEFRILYGIKKNAFHRPDESIWHKKRSPPEALNPKFDLKKIPTFYFFDSSGMLLGVIIENPKFQSTLEEDMLTILKHHF